VSEILEIRDRAQPATDDARTSTLTIDVPTWADELAAAAGPLDSDDARMKLAIGLARRNVDTGGSPFGAAVFHEDRLLAVGVNCVLSSGFSIAHGEIVALMRAEKAAGRRALPGTLPLTLVTSTEPCCQCFGALVWAGVTRLVCGATTEDAEAIGFDEGPKPDGWAAVLERRGIAVTLAVRRDEAAEVLRAYQRTGGAIYGGPRST
jgi:tRNA(Arg) A34 adenosine deaminase TadA